MFKDNKNLNKSQKRKNLHLEIDNMRRSQHEKKQQHKKKLTISKKSKFMFLY